MSGFARREVALRNLLQNLGLLANVDFWSETLYKGGQADSFFDRIYKLVLCRIRRFLAMRIFSVIVCLGLFFNLAVCGSDAKGVDIIVQDGKQVSFEYTLTLEGETVDSSKGREPLRYVHGQGQIISGLEEELAGLRVGEEKVIKVSSQKGYGEVNPEAFREFPKTALSENLEPEVDMILQLQGPGGQVIPARVAKVKDEVVVLDLNHPLAGKTLTFEVKIVSIE